MNEELLDRLQKETNCDKVFASMLLKFTGGDIDGALEIMKSVNKDIYILKGKFIGQTTKYYGAFIIVFNAKSKSYHLQDIVFVKEDKSGIEFDFSRNWRDYYQDLKLYKKRNIIDGDKCSRFASFIVLPKTLTQLESKLTSQKDNREDELQNLLCDILINTLGDVNVALKLKIDKTDIFELNRGIDDAQVFAEEETDDLNKAQEIKEDQELIFLKIEPEISPINGVSLSELQRGDLIFVKIIDNRPIADYIAKLLKANNTENGSRIGIYAELKDVEVVEHGVYLTVEFGPGIYGRAYFGEDVKVTIKKDLFDTVIDKENKNEKESFVMKYFWVFGGVLFAITFALLILFFYYSS